MPNFYYKITIEYDGTDFCGWQIQPNKRTVQGELESALFSLFQENIRVTASGRTDAGVHALGQVINFSTSKSRSLKEIEYGINSLLPEDISVKIVEPVTEEFNSRYKAIRRHYIYQIIREPSALRNRFAWCLKNDLNIHDMHSCTELILGEHNFQSFCSSNAEVNHYQCTVEKAIWYYKNPKLLVFSIYANRFLHNMVRVLVGTMVEVGKGRFSIDDFENMLFKKNRKYAGLTAPARGLFLVKVEY